jgi:hypothetical protein
VTEYRGVAAAQQQFANLVSGKTAPDAGIILRLQH